MKKVLPIVLTGILLIIFGFIFRNIEAQRDVHLLEDIDPEKVNVQGFFPNNDLVRRDIADYGMEVEDYSYYEMAFGKRVEEELFDIIQDPDCINNLAYNTE